MTDPVRSQSDPDSKSRKKKIESLEIEEEREPDNSNTRRGSGATCYGPDAVSVSLGGKANKKKKEKQIAGVNARSSAGFLNCGTIFKASQDASGEPTSTWVMGVIHTNNDVYILACLSAKAQPFTTSNGFLRITHQFYCNLDNKCKVVFMVRPALDCL
jgi:hypothetical protein